MQTNKNKTMATLITVILIIGMSIPLFAIQPVSAGLDNATAAAKAAGMKWDFPALKTSTLQLPGCLCGLDGKTKYLQPCSYQ